MAALFHRLLTGHAVTLVGRKHPISQEAETKAGGKLWPIIQPQFSAYRLRHGTSAARTATQPLLSGAFLSPLLSLWNAKKGSFCTPSPTSLKGRRRLPPWCFSASPAKLFGWLPSFPSVFSIHGTLCSALLLKLSGAHDLPC